MKTRLATFLFLIVGLSTSLARAEIWVDAAASGDGDGSTERPFRTINDAIKVATGGDTITVHKGTYPEVVTLKLSGDREHPTVLRAAPGERVILSGFAPVPDWKAEANGVYSAVVDGKVSDLYVGYARQTLASWPAVDQPMRQVKSSDPNAGVFQDNESLANQPALKAIAGDLKSASALLCPALGNGYIQVPLSTVDAGAGKFSVTPDKFFATIKGPPARFAIINHPALIEKAGDWAFEKLGDKQNKIYFKPSNADDLKRVQFRQAPARVIYIGHDVENIRVEGLEICGSANFGIQIDRADNIVVSHCIIHNNSGVGLSARQSGNITFENNVCVANGSGMSITSTHSAVIGGNEIAFNLSNGIGIYGSVAPPPNHEPPTIDVTFKNNYVHDHLLRANANSCFWMKDATEIKLQDNLFLFGMRGPAVQTQGGASIKNCAIIGTETFVFDSAGKSLVAGSKFKNSPTYTAVAQCSDSNRTDHLLLILNDKPSDITGYKQGDVVEVNGDGVVRHITNVGKDSIDFSPPLAARPFRNTLVWNWKQAVSVALDFRSPEAKGPNDPKSTDFNLDVSAYQRGEFYGDGKRSIPLLPEDIKDALPKLELTGPPIFGQ